MKTILPLGVCGKRATTLMDSAKELEEYKGLNWEEHAIEPVRKRSNWYGLTINDTDIWEGLLLGSRSRPPMYPFESTILGTTYFPETMELLGSYTKNIIMSASVAVFPTNSIMPDIMDTNIFLECIYHYMFQMETLVSVLVKKVEVGKLVSV